VLDLLSHLIAWHWLPLCLTAFSLVVKQPQTFTLQRPMELIYPVKMSQKE
jgi:hypothetical protein